MIGFTLHLRSISAGLGLLCTTLAAGGCVDGAGLGDLPGETEGQGGTDGESTSSTGGGTDDPSETDGETDPETGGETDGETDGDTDGDTDGEPSETCDSVVVDHEDDCGPDCPIVADVRITCDANAFGDPGLRVAPGAESTWLVTASDASAWLMSIEADGLASADRLPEETARSTISLALDLDGAPVMVADTTDASDDYAGGVTVVTGSEGNYELDLVFDGDVYSSVFDMEIDAGGQPHVWASTDPPDGRSEFVQEADGSWTERDAPVPGTSGWQRFTVTPQGVPVGFDFDDQGGNWQLMALSEGEAEPVGTMTWPDYPGAYVHIAAPVLPSLVADAPDYVVLAEDVEGYRLAWQSDAGGMDVLLEDTAAFQRTCVFEGDGSPGSCPAACEEQGSGVESPMAAVTRTSDGRVWAAWMWTQLDQSLSVTETCDKEIGCYCNSTVEREDSYGELVLAEVDLETLEVREVFRLRDQNPHTWGLFSGLRESPRALDMRAFGSDLAVGARVRDEGGFDPAAMRVLRVDTALIP